MEIWTASLFRRVDFSEAGSGRGSSADGAGYLNARDVIEVMWARTPACRRSHL